MITLEQIEFWLQHRTFPTLPDRLRADQDPLNYAEWTAIEDVVSRLTIDQADLSSPAFRHETNLILEKLTDSERGRKLLREAAAGRDV
jgi:hypothetical protein